VTYRIRRQARCRGLYSCNVAADAAAQNEVVNAFRCTPTYCLRAVSAVTMLNSQTSNQLISASSSKRQRVESGKVDLIHPSFIRIRLLGFASHVNDLSFGFINPTSIDRIRKGVKKVMAKVQLISNEVKAKRNEQEFTYECRPVPAPNDSKGRTKCPWGLSAGAISMTAKQYCWFVHALMLPGVIV
jgi:hypothetical protein